MLVSTDLAMRVSSRPSSRPVEDLPRWRGRLEQLWRLQVEGIIELSLAYHEAASAARAGGPPDPAGFRRRQVRRILARTASARHALAEIEAAMGRVDTASYGICESCRLPMRAGWLHASPQIRYCQDCDPHQNGPRQVSLARAGVSPAKAPAAAWI
jgi:RNA polymerase-binding transcription factor DksA